MNICSAGNTEAPSYVYLLENGYEVTVVDSVFGKSIFSAKKAGIELVAYSILELLGLAMLVEKKGCDWRISDQQIDDFLSKFGG